MSKVLLILSLLLGADVKLKAPETAIVGQPVLVDAADSVGDLEWDTNDSDVVIFTAIRGAKQAYVQGLAPGAGRFWVTARDKSGTSTSREVILFTADGPSPAPKPVPEPSPTPDVGPVKLPEGRFKVSQAAHDKVPRAERRRQEAEAVAAQLASLRDKIKRGEVDPTKTAVIKEEIQKATSELPNELRHRWADWGSWWGNFLMRLVLGGSLKTAADWIALLEETILGLRAVT